jgi:hypothetical protein
MVSFGVEGALNTRWVLAGFATCFVCHACGGSTAAVNDGGGPGDSGGGSSSGSSGSSGGSSSGGSSGSGSGGPSMACPGGVPTPGAPCPVVGAHCEYGTSPSVACNTVVECGANGWIPPLMPQCPMGTCPASYSDVSMMQACSQDGLSCAYPEGQCNCTIAGASPQSPTVWQCFTPAKVCAEPRPRLGTSCYPPGITCDYGSCSGGVEERCTSGYWQVITPSCP